MSKLFSYELEQYLQENKKYLGDDIITAIKPVIQKSNIPISELYNIKFKSPTTATMLAVFLGHMGIDRFYAGDYIHGAIKLVSCGICLIGWFVDIAIIGNRIKSKNAQKLYKVLTGEDIDVNLKIDKDKLKNIWKDENVRTYVKGFISASKNVRDTMDPDKM